MKNDLEIELRVDSAFFFSSREQCMQYTNKYDKKHKI